MLLAPDSINLAAQLVLAIHDLRNVDPKHAESGADPATVVGQSGTPPQIDTDAVMEYREFPASVRAAR
jgi:hypothetical protein